MLLPVDDETTLEDDVVVIELTERLELVDEDEADEETDIVVTEIIELLELDDETTLELDD